MSMRMPGPGVLSAWLAATMPAPLVFFEWTHRWEEDQPVSTALWWPVLASPVLAAVLAARQPSRPGPAVGVSTLAATALLAVALAFFRWVVPLTGEARWGRALLGGAALAVAGSLIGYAARGRLRVRERPAARLRDRRARRRVRRAAGADGARPSRRRKCRRRLVAWRGHRRPREATCSTTCP
ncbi:hypothetical protein AB0B20_00135 [Micromonospora sp. NPDC049151]|uniref:hypothetical protein n=1 Tax=Micromonospora sp. NPDC049151 TaxID=3155648 RepID=UPI0033F54BDD